MKITATKIKRELVKEHEWSIDSVSNPYALQLIADTIKIIDKILKEQKGMSIK